VVELAVGVFAGVSGPHAEVRLCHVSKGRINGISSYGLTTGGNEAGPVHVGEDEEVRDRVNPGLVETGVDVVIVAEDQPALPPSFLGSGSACHDSGSDRFLSSAEVIEVLISGRG
jgi:hypothetical protein